MEALAEPVCIRWADQVHKPMRQASECFEINWQVSKVVPTHEALGIQQVQQGLPCEALWKVAYHDCGARPSRTRKGSIWRRAWGLHSGRRFANHCPKLAKLLLLGQQICYEVFLLLLLLVTLQLPLLLNGKQHVIEG